MHKPTCEGHKGAAWDKLEPVQLGFHRYSFHSRTAAKSASVTLHCKSLETLRPSGRLPESACASCRH